MGAFILFRRPPGTSVADVEERYRHSLGIFSTMGLPLNQRIVTENFILHVFHKYNFPTDNVAKFDNGQFAVGTGTFIYNRKTGQQALKALFDDFHEDGDSPGALGQYCAIVYKNGRLNLFSDYTGLYHVYRDKTHSIISSSFLAVLKSLDKKNISSQGLYEYMINGACFGDATMIDEIGLLNSKKIWRWSPEILAFPRHPQVRSQQTAVTFKETVDGLAAGLADYFRIIGENFGTDICSALSGGVHTRLMLGLMRQAGIRPDYLYVYGSENNITGRDANVIQIVKAMARSEGLSVDYIDREKFPGCPEDEYLEQLRRYYYLGDGISLESGAFDNGADIYHRLARTKKGRLQLNGGGGEVLRNYWKLPNHAFSIKEFFKARYDRADFSIFTNCFNADVYFSVLSEKVKLSLGVMRDRLSRIEIELLQPEFDNKYWMGGNNSINNTLAYSLTPFGEPWFQYRCCGIPYKYKNYFHLESALMKHIDAPLARYPTSHGIDLYNDHLETTARLKYLLTLNTPLWLKTYMRKHFWHQKTEILRLRGNYSALPFYLTPSYRSVIFPAGNLEVSRYVNIDRIIEPELLSRALTAELVVTDRF
jgi:hypothetical protein